MTPRIPMFTIVAVALAGGVLLGATVNAQAPSRATRTTRGTTRGTKAPTPSTHIPVFSGKRTLTEVPSNDPSMMFSQPGPKASSSPASGAATLAGPKTTAATLPSAGVDPDLITPGKLRSTSGKLRAYAVDFEYWTPDSMLIGLNEAVRLEASPSPGKDALVSCKVKPWFFGTATFHVVHEGKGTKQIISLPEGKQQLAFSLTDGGRATITCASGSWRLTSCVVGEV